MSHGIIERKAEDEFETYASFLGLSRGELPYDVEIQLRNEYVFQIAGPTSLQVLEKVTRESLSDIRFLSFRDTRINGKRAEIARLGMSGNLAYELHGPIEDGPMIYNAVYEAGKEFGIERLGWGPISSTMSRVGSRSKAGHSSMLQPASTMILWLRREATGN